MPDAILQLGIESGTLVYRESMMPFKPVHATGVILAVAAIAYVVLSDGAEAMRYFNYGVKSYKDKKFGLAAHQFQKAAELSPNATTAYNLALARWAEAIEAAEEPAGPEGDQEDGKPSVSGVALRERTTATRTAITEALENFELGKDQEANLIYCDGTMLALEGSTEEARARLRQAAEKRDDFKAALVGLVKLEAVDSSKPGDPAQLLLLAVADAEKPEIVEKYAY